MSFYAKNKDKVNALGCVDDDTERLKAMINYLEAHKIGLVNVA